MQGPRSAQLFDAFFHGRYSRPARNEILAVEIDGAPYFIARTGYTGEDGFEVFCPPDRAVKTWNDILIAERNSASSRAAWARATRCAWRCAIR